MLPLDNERLDNPLTKQIPSAAAATAGKIASSPLQPLSSEEIAPNVVSKKESALDIPASETVRPLVQTPAIKNPPPSAPLDNKNDIKTANPFFGDTIKPLAPPKEMKPDKPLLIPDSENKPLIVSQPAIKTTPAMSAAMAEPALEIPKDTANNPAAVFQQKIPEKTMEKQSAAIFTAQPKLQNPLPAASLADKVPAANFADRTGEPSLGSSLQRQLNEMRSPSDAEPELSFQNKNTAGNLPLLNMPQNPDSATENPLLKLVPTGTPAENAAEIKRTLPPETSAPKPLLAEVNTGYRRSMESARPAPLQIAGMGANGSNTAGVPNEGRATLFLDKIDEQIKRSPAATERYTVQPGDTYMTISDQKFGTSLLYRALAAHNRRLGIDYMPASGTVIEIPTAEFLKTNYADVLSRGNYRREAQNNGGFKRVSSASQQGGQPLASSSANPSAQHYTVLNYTVQQNDNVFKIAMNQLGDTSRWREILALNSDTISDPRNLQPGTKIVLPNQSSSVNTAARSRGVY
jgi:nucleoid-associated protein YgaU